MATLIGLFDNGAQAQAAVDRLRTGGIDPAMISVMARGTQEEIEDAVKRADLPDSMATGVMGGGVLGGITGFAIAVLGLATWPILGPLVLAGPLAATLIGAGVGATAGGVIGALVDMGIPHDEATLYHTGVERGAVLLIIHDVPPEKEADVRALMEQAGMRDIHEHLALWEKNPAYRYGPETSTDNEVITLTSDAVGGAAGALAGGVVGSTLAGPLGTLAGMAIGGAAGAGAAHIIVEPATTSAGPTIAGATGAMIGAAVGTLAGPAGTVIGAGVGAAAGGAVGEGIEDIAERMGNAPMPPNYPNN
jgi:hypothetical protein